MRLLAIDTALGHCAACVLDGTTASPIAQETLAQERGHAEALLPLIERVMSRIDGGFESLARIAVTVGPGSFTGIRVGLSAARAIGVALGVPVVGVTTLSAYIAALIGREKGRVVAATLDARHGQVYVQAVAASGRTLIAPRLTSIRETVRLIGAGPVSLAGTGAPLVASEAWSVGLGALVIDANPGPDIAWVARIGLLADPDTAPPRPFYLRDPDAKPQDHVRVPRR